VFKPLLSMTNSRLELYRIIELLGNPKSVRIKAST
jgi:hypothetical protein